MKHVYPCYSKQTRTAIEELNAAIARAKSERADTAAAISALEADAVAGKIDFATIRQRADAVRERRLKADLIELQAMQTLEHISELHKRDLAAEADRQAALAAKRAEELDKKATEMGAGPLQRDAMQREDKAWNAHETARHDAYHAAADGLLTSEDSKRIEELRRDVAAQVAAMLR